MGYCTHVGLMVPLTWCRQHGVDRLVPLNSRVVLKPAGFLRTKVNVFFQGWGRSPGAQGHPPARRAETGPKSPAAGASQARTRACGEGCAGVKRASAFTARGGAG